jgi:hypothetical protein
MSCPIDELPKELKRAQHPEHTHDECSCCDFHEWTEADACPRCGAKRCDWTEVTGAGRVQARCFRSLEHAGRHLYRR